MRRFYAEAAAVPGEGGYVVTLDGREVRTPGRRVLRLPTRPMGEAIAAEWREQGEEIEPAGMGLTRLANSALDRTGPNRTLVIGQVAEYGGADLLCYRADAPGELVARQDAAWQPLLDWLAEAHGARLRVTTGVTPIEQARDALLAVFTAVAAFDDFRLTGLHAATASCGSVALGLALAARRIDAEEAWRVAHLDEIFQAGRWGTDSEAEARRCALLEEIATAGRFMALAADNG